MFNMTAAVYDTDVYVIISEDTLQALMFLRSFLQDTSLVTKDLDVKGVVFSNPGHPPVMWIPKIPRTPEEMGVVAHEMFHLVACIMDYVNIPLDDSSEEAYAYMYSHLNEQFWTKIEEYKKDTNIP